MHGRIPWPTDSLSVKSGDKLYKHCFIWQSIISSLEGEIST